MNYETPVKQALTNFSRARLPVARPLGKKRHPLRSPRATLSGMSHAEAMMSMRIHSALALFCAVFAASCVQGSVGAESTPTAGKGGVAQPVEPLDQADATSEPTGEAAQAWTRADCIAMWQQNGNLCNSSPPHARVACFAAVATMMTACLAAAQGQGAL